LDQLRGGQTSTIPSTAVGHSHLRAEAGDMKRHHKAASKKQHTKKHHQAKYETKQTGTTLPTACDFCGQSQRFALQPNRAALVSSPVGDVFRG
jgi:hypothetical protein